MTPDPLHFCVTCGQPIGSEEVAAEMLAALKEMIEPWALFTDAEIRTDIRTTPKRSSAVLAARAAIARADLGP